MHTPLRLPMGRFCSWGTRTNVIFFDKMPANETPPTNELRTNGLRTIKFAADVEDHDSARHAIIPWTRAVAQPAPRAISAGA